ncbi:MAG: cell division protein ZapA [Clostridia bacterium]|nr:cell division protein ZapA [Clostridia bacterium]
MKQKFTITLLDIPVSIVSDENEETVKALAAKLNDRVTSILWKSRQISKTEAALFTALEYLSEVEGAKTRADKAEAQLELYSSNIVRLREENERLSKKVDELEAKLKRK